MTASRGTSEGSCLCGLVRFQIAGPLEVMNHCHCTDCRKSHGAAFASYVRVLRDRFTIVQGEEGLQIYAADTGTLRFFCGTCGASIYCDSPSWKAAWVAAATFDSPLDLPNQWHIFVRSKVAWFEIRDDLPQYAGYPEDEP